MLLQTLRQKSQRIFRYFVKKAFFLEGIQRVQSPSVRRLILALKYFRKSYLRSAVGYTRLSIATIYIERSYANRIFQVLMDRIIDIFRKRKNRESFMQTRRALIILLYIRFRKKIGSIVLCYITLQTTLCKFPYLRCNR